MNQILFCAITVAILSVSSSWDNEYDKVLQFQCPTNFSVSGIRSLHDNGKEDRVFEILCRYTGPTSSCSWSGYVNSFDEFFSFQCANHGFIHGMHSIHDNGHEDRRWDYYCCARPGFTPSECYQTTHTNWDAYFSIDVPDNSVMRGVTSTHDNGKEDREYIFEICKLREY